MNELDEHARKRAGCDLCKEDVPTYLFKPLKRDSLMRLWFCEACYAALVASHNFK